jgi:murein DD-endopeptidase MepM/ murein hydrolase activator NlpD
MIAVQQNAGSSSGFRKIFRPRDIFLHDGSSLKRVRLGTGVQVGAFLALLFLLLWSALATAALAAGGAADSRVAGMERQVAAMQAEVGSIKQQVQVRLATTEGEVRKLGFDPSRFQGQGGPFEAVEPLKAGDPNFKQLFTSWKKLDQFEHGVIAIPSTKPVHDANFTSGYGVRSDPFRGYAAMHAGIDLAGPYGTPVYATADATVGRSQWVNGYGNLIELDHGRGIQTRYGHLSRSVVAPGQHVKRGQLIAYTGSTGRSTGPHLHYEVRIDGQAVNPIPFMQSNDYLQAVQRRVAAAGNGRVAMGGPDTTALR